MEKIISNEQFSFTLVQSLANKAHADIGLQACAVFAVNQSIEHGNADPAIRLVKQMQESKYGNLGAMVKYLCLHGHLTVVKNTICYEQPEEAKPLLDAETVGSMEWKDHAKVETVEKPVDDAFVKLVVAKLLKRINSYAKKHPGKAASDKTINGLNALLT